MINKKNILKFIFMIVFQWALILFPINSYAQNTSTLPDWSGVWERYEGNGGMFDISTTKPPEGRAGRPVVVHLFLRGCRTMDSTPGSIR